MKKLVFAMMMVSLFVGPPAGARTNITYTCAPEQETPLLEKVVITHSKEMREDIMILTQKDAYGKATELREIVDYYDDMDFMGYRSEVLDAAVEFRDEETTFFLGLKKTAVQCQEEWIK